MRNIFLSLLFGIVCNLFVIEAKNSLVSDFVVSREENPKNTVYRYEVCHEDKFNVNDEIVSSGIFSSIYNNDAILTSVSTVPEFRRMGYGSALVSAMICDIKGKVYLMRDKNKNEKFYKKLGFENMGYWRMYK